MERKFGEYATDVSDEEWAFCGRYLTLMREEAPQREYPLRAVFNALRYMVRAGCPWRLLPNDLPPWWVVHQQAMRWIAAGSFEAEMRPGCRPNGITSSTTGFPISAEGRTSRSSTFCSLRNPFDSRSVTSRTTTR